jgi:hypothetical protein
MGVAIVYRLGIPLDTHLTDVFPHEVALVEEALGAGFLTDRSRRLIGDRVYVQILYICVSDIKLLN